MPTFGYLPYQGWVFLFIFLTLKHFLHLSEEKHIFAEKAILSNHGDIIFFRYGFANPEFYVYQS